jgi:hypothetical protein
MDIFDKLVRLAVLALSHLPNLVRKDTRLSGASFGYTIPDGGSLAINICSAVFS